MVDAIDTMGDEWLEEAGVTQEAEPETPAPAPEPENPAPTQDETPAEVVDTDPKQVPLAALKEEREKRQALERKFAELESRVDRPAQQAHPTPRQKAPDAYEDPDAFADHIEARIAERDFQNRALVSRRFADKEYGKDTVIEAIEWAKGQSAQDPSFDYKIGANESPVEYVVQEYKRSQTLQQIGDKSFEDAAREYAQTQGWIVSQPDAPSGASIQKPSSPTPPKSLSQAPGSGGLNQAPKNADWSEVKFALD